MPKPKNAKSIDERMAEFEQFNQWCPPTLPEWLNGVDTKKPWIIDNIIPEDALILLSGQQKRAYKSWLAFGIAISVAAQKPFGLFRPLKTGNVLIIEEEGPKASTKERFLMLCNDLNVDPNSLSNIYFSHRQRVRLDDEVWRQKLVSFIEQKNPILTIYDSLTFAHTGDENSREDMEPVIETLHTLRTTNNSSVIFLAHLDKQRGENPRMDHDIQVKGSGYITQNYDVHLALRRYKRSDPKIDLSIHARDNEDQKYCLTWDIVSPEKAKDKKGHAKVSMLQVIEGEKPNDNLIQKCKSLLEADPDTSWTLKRLKEIWECSEKTAKQVVEQMVNEEYLAKSEKGQFELLG